VFGKQAKLTLAAWDLEEATQAAVSDPTLPRAILEYFISPQNIRPKLLPGLIENPSVSEDALVVLATEGSRDVVRALLGSARARRSHKILGPACAQPATSPLRKRKQVRAWLNGTGNCAWWAERNRGSRSAPKGCLRTWGRIGSDRLKHSRTKPDRIKP